MRKSIELKQKLNKLTDELKAMLDGNDYEGMTAKKAEIEKVQAAIDAAEMVEGLEGSHATNGGAVPVGNTATPEDAHKMHNRAFVKAILGRNMSETEKAYAMTLVDAVGTPGQAEGTPDKGGYLVPTEQVNVITEYRRHRIALKNMCDVVNVSTYTGTAPAVDGETGALTDFDELNEIPKNDKTFKQIAWKLHSYGDIVPVSNELLADTNVDLVGFIARRFATMAVNAENAKIFALMKATTIKQTGKDYKAILTALNRKLDAEISQNASIFVDAIGFDYLDSAEDKNGRPLLTQSYADPAAKMFRGHPVVQLPSTVSTGSTDEKIIMYVGSLSDAVKFFDRQGVTMAVSTEAGFTQNKTMLRAVERFDVQAADAEAMVEVTITTAASGQAVTV